MAPRANTARSIALALAILIVASAGALLLARGTPSDQPRTEGPVPPLVRAVIAQPRSLALSIRAQGTVSPRTETDLIPQVSGEILRTAASFTPGGFFREGDLLVELDPRDYEISLDRARAVEDRAQSEARLAEANFARLRELSQRDVISSSALDDAETRARGADAALRQARADTERAARDLDKTRLYAPFDGRVRARLADAGQFAARGVALARVYAVDYAEVRLPVPDRALSRLDLPAPLEDGDRESGPRVVLRGSYGGRPHEWHGHVVRTEAEIDTRSRLVHLVARVRDPYGRASAEPQPPLEVGMFVDAEIAGRRLDAAVLLPLEAVRDDGRVLVVDDDDRIHFRDVVVAGVQGQHAVIERGLREGERVCVTPLELAVEGMQVRVEMAGAPAARTGIAAE